MATFPVWAFGYALSTALPGKTGDIVRLEVHRRYQDLSVGDSASIVIFTRIYDMLRYQDLSVGDSASIVIFTRIYDMLFVIIFSALGVIIVTQQYFLSLNAIYFTAFIFMLLCFVIVFAVLVAWKNFYESVELYKTLKYPLVAVPILTALRWFIELFATVLIFRSIGASVSIWTIALAISVSLLVGIATAMPASIGTGTLAGFAIYRLLGIADDIAVAATLIGLFLGPGVTIICGISSLVFLELRKWVKQRHIENDESS
jgi:uncharacterized membrane protein YbhN (UPF0104 family)